MAAHLYTPATQATDPQRDTQLVLPWNRAAPVFKGFVFYSELMRRTRELLDVVNLHFVVIPDLKEYIECVLREYEGWLKESFSLEVVFDTDAPESSLQLDQQEQVVDSYKIKPLFSSNKITMDDVRYFKPGRRIPHCGLQLLLPPEKTPPSLRHKVDISGAKSPGSIYFYIRYPLPEHNLVGAQGSSSATPPGAMTSTTDPSLTSSVHVGESPRSNSVATPPDAMISTSSASSVQGDDDTRGTTTVAMKETSIRGKSYMYGRESTIYEHEGRLSSLLRTEKKKREPAGYYLTHHLSSNPHGLVLVFGNEDFYLLPCRKATDIDICNFAETFKSLGYVVQTYKNYTAEQIKSEVTRIARRYSEDYDSIVLCFSTHGENNEYIFGSDSVPLNVYELVSLIRERCVLNDKPILMFIQCCRAKDQSASHNVDLSSLLGFPDSKPGLFIAWAASRLSLAYRSPENGSFFPAALRDVFIEHSHRHDLYTMMLAVKKKVHEEDFEQSPEIVDRLQYKVFFHPPQCC